MNPVNNIKFKKKEEKKASYFEFSSINSNLNIVYFI